MDNKIYNPASQDKQWLIEHFVVRTHVFERLFKDILNGTMKYPEQHYLIQGQRGMGKTTLLLRLKYEIENTPQLNSWLIPVFFNEESYDLTSLSNLWEKLLKYLDNLWNTGGTYYNQTDAFMNAPDYENKCFDLLLSILHKEKKKLVIFFDNFGQLFLDHLKPKEQHRFREILMTCSDLRIIASSAIVITDLHDYSKPFFEFFRIINLEGLSKDETLQLITKLQDKTESKIDLEKNKAKIETLAILTGGVIRTIMLIYEVILADEDGSALRDLEAILDRITPLFKHRIEDLPVQQRKIVDVIARKWDAVSTKEISENIRENGQQMSSKLVSAQLQQLEKNNVIEKKQTHTKNHLYQLKERFFNIWYLMRNGDRMDRNRVIWLTKFLEVWYEDERSFDDFLKQCTKQFRSGKYHPGSALMLMEALAQSDKVNVQSLDEVIQITANLLDQEQKKLLPKLDNKKYLKAKELCDQKEYTKAINLLKSIQQESFERDYLLIKSYIESNNLPEAHTLASKIQVQNSNQLLSLALIYLHLENYGRALDLLEKYDGNQQSDALYFKALAYQGINNVKQAITCLKKLLAKPGENFAYPQQAFQMLIQHLQATKDYDGAITYALRALELGIENVKKLLIESYLLSGDDANRGNAKKVLDEELAKTPKDPDLLHLNGARLSFMGDIKEAKAHFIKAHNLYLQQKELIYYNYLNLLTLLNVTISLRPDKKLAKTLITDAETAYPALNNYFSFFLFYSFVLIWNSEYKSGFHVLTDGLDQSRYGNKSHYEFDLLQHIILLLLSRKQYHTVLNLFNQEGQEFKDQMKPIYYALMHYLKEEFPNEYLKMGDELKQPVEDVMKKVEEMAHIYQ